ncbi:Glycosyltransferase involved in cell wall bisynthesis [Anaerocolumna jejuensis DSM 15929]|uniref:Glycosyltransferase involved in cell wall bisynthesis n=1 Tax=Anaerocolumna jejuensis DSM 15929 TaxID=1121322 RepID=A0A1M6UFR9_9FIRM|nr:glycosyltransferase family 4 protein [Anaerocolumna jejuensis]SHK68011.1 Glycosyltransferase involved in cell wall bisynthesis [Anaerocolumna jejuensis DSM 15929]
MQKIAIINQRYGLEVNGGSEFYTRQIASKLKDYYEIEILTTRAIDYMTWADYYPEGLQNVDGIPVRRFSVKRTRDMKKFNNINAELLTSPVHNEELETRWTEEQGPLSIDLIKYIETYRNDYDVFIFVTYLYYLTVTGLPLVAEKAILIPTAHDEPYAYFQIYNKIFNLPKAIVYLTEEEKNFVQNKFLNKHIYNDVLGAGIDVPDVIKAGEFRSKYKILNEYIIYVGRIDYGKNCDWLFRYFTEYKKRHNTSDLKLILMGKEVMEVPNHPDIISLGFVSDEDKFNGLAGAKVLILPSEFESLSISVLEAMAISVPVVVNGKCEVLKGHCIKSKAGLYYHNYFEFEEILNYIFKYDGIYQQMKKNAKEYIIKNYQWNTIIERFKTIIQSIK